MVGRISGGKSCNNNRWMELDDQLGFKTNLIKVDAIYGCWQEELCFSLYRIYENLQYLSIIMGPK